MNSRIVKELTRIEGVYDIQIIYACESGSRSFGSQNEDSDYDVRIIYHRAIRNYLKINKERDNFEKTIDSHIELSGWDIFKALELFHKSNPSLLEWLFSSVVYIENKELMSRLRSLAHETYSLKKLSYHYINLLKANDKVNLVKKPLTTKSVKILIQQIRALLMIQYMYEKQRIPPIRLEELLSNVNNGHIINNWYSRLIESKHSQTQLPPAIFEKMTDYIRDKIEFFEQSIHLFEDKKMDEDKLNCILWKALGVDSYEQ
ncbi:nucleotidyltransferase domain-containing protein [Bacillus timonensis]|nr:nucleotidyltransferase domain-containing protein [Bacillus timonensis]